MAVDGAVTSGMGAATWREVSQAASPQILDDEWAHPSFQMKRPSLVLPTTKGVRNSDPKPEKRATNKLS
jgi:hypothetical protein